MHINHKSENRIAFIRELCQNKTGEEIIEAEEVFSEYILIIKDIADQDMIESKFDFN